MYNNSSYYICNLKKYKQYVTDNETKAYRQKVTQTQTHTVTYRDTETQTHKHTHAHAHAHAHTHADTHTHTVSGERPNSQHSTTVLGRLCFCWCGYPAEVAPLPSSGWITRG